jgi:hypothetical protein
MTIKKQIIITKKIDDQHFSGTIEVAMLNYPERIAHSKKSVTKVIDGVDGANFVATENLDRAEEYYNLATQQVIKMDVKLLSEDRVLSSVDELIVYEEGNKIIMDLAAELIAGITLGNEKSDGSSKTA